MTPKQDCERLIAELLPVAEKMLAQFGEFLPYGAYLRASGEVVHVGAEDPTTHHPSSQTLINALKQTFRSHARTKQVKAAAIAFDVRVPLPNTSQKSDAIQVCVDHVSGYSAEVFLPYRLDGNQLTYGETFAQAGDHELIPVALVQNGGGR